MIAGTEGLLVTYARCCFPIPNDPIMAYLSAGRGVMIHRQNCGNLAEYRKQPEKWLSVAWEATHGRLFSSRDPAGNQQSGGRAGGGRLEHRGNRNQYRSGLAGRARREQLLAQISAAGARPQASGAASSAPSAACRTCSGYFALWPDIARPIDAEAYLEERLIHEQADHFHRGRAGGHRHLFAGRSRRQHYLGLGPDSLGSGNQGIGTPATWRRRCAACSTI